MQSEESVQCCKCGAVCTQETAFCAACGEKLSAVSPLPTGQEIASQQQMPCQEPALPMGFGGWMIAFVVLFSIVALITFLSGSLSLIAVLLQISDASTVSLLFIVVAGFILSGFSIVFLYFFCRGDKRAHPVFLWYFLTETIIILVNSTLLSDASQSINHVGVFLGFGLRTVIVLWYFRKSKRVRSYFGTNFPIEQAEVEATDEDNVNSKKR